MASSKEKEILLNVIEIYKDMPYLWNKSHGDYKNKSLRDDGFRVLLEVYRNFEPSADVKAIKKKLENMRSTYLEEEKKVTASKQTGAGSEDVYVPRLWYYEAFRFLGSATEPCCEVRDSLENDESSLSETEDDWSHSSTSSGTSSNKRRRKGPSLSKRQESLMDIAEKLMTREENEWEVMGRLLGLQLKDMDQRTVSITQKLISDLVYYAKLGKLTEDSYITLGTTNFNQSIPSLYHTLRSPLSSSLSSVSRTQSPYLTRTQSPYPFPDQDENQQQNEDENQHVNQDLNQDENQDQTQDHQAYITLCPPDDTIKMCTEDMEDFLICRK